MEGRFRDIMAYEFRLRRGTASEWSDANPVLSFGEPGFVTDENNIKIGDGVTAWNSLPYLHDNCATFEVSSDPPENPTVGLIHIPIP
jgi:hypothetical protein